MSLPVRCRPKPDLRDWKRRAHEAFDRLWLDGGMTRPEAYAWMAQVMNLPRHRAHIGLFKVRQCRRLIKLLQRETVS